MVFIKDKKGFLLRCVPCAVIVLGLIFLGLWLGRPTGEVATAASRLVYVPARVETVISDNAEADNEHYEGQRLGDQELEIRILSGEHKGEILPLTNYMGALFNVDVREGDRIVVRLQTEDDGSYYASMYNYDRGMVVGLMLLLFAAVLIALGGKKGARALAGLVITLACIWFLLIPGLIRGIPALPYTVLLVAVVAAACLILLNGFSAKTFCSAAGCIAGVAAAALTAWIVGKLAPIDGFNMEEAEDMLLHGTELGLRIRGLLVCGVLVSSLGAVMDVAMSIASAIWELRESSDRLTVKELFRSGMQIGRDAMGTMANTLILAFAGSSLNMLIMAQIYDIPLMQLVNTDSICIEVIQSIAGSLGILLTVPLTAAGSARYMKRKSSAENT